MSRLVGNVKECTIALSFSDTGVAILKKQFYKNLTKYLVVYFYRHIIFRTPVRFQLPGTYISSGGGGKGSGGTPHDHHHQIDQRLGGNDQYIFNFVN